MKKKMIKNISLMIVGIAFGVLLAFIAESQSDELRRNALYKALTTRKLQTEVLDCGHILMNGKPIKIRYLEYRLKPKQDPFDRTIIDPIAHQYAKQYKNGANDILCIGIYWHDREIDQDDIYPSQFIWNQQIMGYQKAVEDNQGKEILAASCHYKYLDNYWYRNAQSLISDVITEKVKWGSMSQITKLRTQVYNIFYEIDSFKKNYDSEAITKIDELMLQAYKIAPMRWELKKYKMLLDKIKGFKPSSDFERSQAKLAISIRNYLCYAFTTGRRYDPDWASYGTKNERLVLHKKNIFPKIRKLAKMVVENPDAYIEDSQVTHILYSIASDYADQFGHQQLKQFVYEYSNVDKPYDYSKLVNIK